MKCGKSTHTHKPIKPSQTNTVTTDSAHSNVLIYLYNLPEKNWNYQKTHVQLIIVQSTVIV